jgi:hypothetical protein
MKSKLSYLPSLGGSLRVGLEVARGFMLAKIRHWAQVHPSAVFGPLGLAVSLMNASFLARASVSCASAYIPLMVISYLLWIFVMIKVCCVSCECQNQPPSLESIKKAARIPLILTLCFFILLVASCLLGKGLIVLFMIGAQIVVGISILLAAISLKQHNR